MYNAIKEKLINSYKREENGSEPPLDVLWVLADFFRVKMDKAARIHAVGCPRFFA